MTTLNDDEPPQDKRQDDDSDLGPEPSWLADPAESTAAPDDVTVEVPVQPVAEAVAIPRAQPEPVPTAARKQHPWLWGAIGLLFAGAAALVAWFSTMQELNDTTIWTELQSQQAALLPAQWTMLLWWAVLPLLAIYLIWSMTSPGQKITRVKLTGLLMIVALGSTILWMVSQLWQWEEVALISIAVATASIGICYVVALLGQVESRWHRVLATAPLGAATAFAAMLLVITWEQDWQQPLGVRGTAVVITLVLVLLAALVSLVLKEPVFPLVLTIWFLGVVPQQWDADKAISLTALVALVFTAVITGLGVLLGLEDQRPTAETTPAASRSGRIKFFNRSQNPPA